LNLNNNNHYLKWLKNSWSYTTGAILLSIFQIITLLITRETWGISAAFANWGGWIFEAFGGDVSDWLYFDLDNVKPLFEAGFLKDPKSIRNLGIIVGALLSTLLASQFKFRKIKSKKQIISAAIGGLLMGYGARLASGCNIGALYSGIASLSLSGWVFGVFIFIGAIIGSKLVVKYLL